MRIKKQKLWRWFLIGLVVLILLFFLLPLLTRLMPSGMNAEKTAQFFKAQHIPFKDTTIVKNGQKVRWIAAGDASKPMILFIHGSPGSWDAFKAYLSDSGLLQKAYLVALDRPGYGGSGRIGLSTLQAQAEAVASGFIFNEDTQRITVVAHSYGGPIAVKLALLFPNQIKQLILIAPTVAPEVEEGIGFKRKAQSMTEWKWWSWTLGSDMMNSAKEMQPLPNEVRQMQKDFSKLNLPITEIHGTEDALAPFANQAYVMHEMKNAQVDTLMLRGKNHFIPFTMPDQMIEIITSKL
jgi:pimeloyl-ACP methyl ester carboxylesterase